MGGIGKNTVVRELAEDFKAARTAIIVNYRGLKVKEVEKLRKELRGAGIKYQVTKNTLARLAARESELPEIEQFLEGPTSLVLSVGDPTLPASILAKFSKEYPSLEIRGGTFQKKVLDAEEVNFWATLPSREELLAKITAGVKNPLYGLVFGLKGIITNFIYALEAIKQKKT